MSKASRKKSDAARETAIDKGSSEPLKKFDGTLLLKKPILPILLIIILGFLAYSNTFHVPFQWDDDQHIVVNPIIRDFGNFISDKVHKEYNPRRVIGYLTFALNYYFGGLNVAGYHVLNLAIHIANAVLVYFFVLITFKTPYFSNEQLAVSSQPGRPASWQAGRLTSYSSSHYSLLTTDYSQFIALFSALLFVSHPVQTQAVTYVVQRFASLATFFYLLSIVLYIRGRLASRQAGRLASYSFCLVSAVCAMLTKEIAFTLPLVLLLYELIFFRGSVKKQLLFLIPVLLTLVIAPISVLHTDKPLGELLSDLSEKSRLQTDMPRLTYLMTQVRVIVTYVRLLLLPINQNLDYDYPISRSFSPSVFLSFLFLASLFGIAVYLLYKTRSAEDKAQSVESPMPYALGVMRFAAFGILWFFITLSVESSVIPIVDVIFEHRVYLPSIGVFAGLSAGLIIAAQRLKSEKLRISALIFIPLLLLGTTYSRNRVWMSEKSLWQDVVTKSPDKARPHNNLGLLYAMQDSLDDAVKEYQTAVKLKPDYAEAHNNLGVIHAIQGNLDDAAKEYHTALKLKPNYASARNNLGMYYAVQGRLDEALKEYETALKLNPDYVDAHNNLGIVYYRQGRLDEALREYETAAKLNLDNADAHNNLGTVYYRQGRLDEALREFQAALRLNFSHVEAHNNLGGLYTAQGRLDEALREYQTALKLNPDNADVHNNLGKVYGRQGRLDEALREFQAALRLNPDFADAHNGIGNVYGSQGRLDEAIKEYKAVLKLAPDNADAHNNLGTVYFRQGRLDEAIKEFETALKLKPDDAGARKNLGIAKGKKQGQ